MSTRRKNRSGKRWLTSPEAARVLNVSQKNLAATARRKDVRMVPANGCSYSYNACDIRKAVR